MAKIEDCPKGCGHETFHYCDAGGTHCDKHCVCTCASCVADRASPAPVDAKTGGKILSGATVYRG